MSNSNMIIDELVREIQSLKGGRPLGFCEPPTAKRIYMNRQYSDALWYFWNGAKNLHEPISDHGIWGIVLGVAVADKTFKGKPDPKLQVKLRSDRLYILECGIETVTARGLISGLAAIYDFSLPIMVTVKAGEDDNVLLCNVYDNDDSRAYTPTDEDTNYSELLQQIQSRLGGNASIEPAPEPVAKAPAIEKPAPRPAVPAPVEAVIEEEEIEYEATFEDEDLQDEPKKIDRGALMGTAKAAIGRLKWDKPTIAQFIGSRFPSKSKTAELSDQQMVDFVDALLRVESGETVSIVDTIPEPLQPKYSNAIKAATTVDELKIVLKGIQEDKETLSSPIADQLSSTANAKIAQIRKAQQEAEQQETLAEIPF